VSRFDYGHRVLPLLLLTLAAPPRLAVVEVDAPELTGLAMQVAHAVEVEAQAQKFEVVGVQELRGKLDVKAYDALKKCGGNGVCASSALRGLGISRVVLGSLGRDEKNYLLKLWLIDVDAGRVIADVDRPILIAARRFQKDVEQAVPALLRGESEARGTLVLTSSAPNADLFLNGVLQGKGEVTLQLKPGKYEVRGERKKYLSTTRLVNVEANQETREELKLLLKPGEVPDAPVAAVAPKKTDEVAQGGAVSPATWVLGGVALAAAGVGLGFGLVARKQEDGLRAGYDTATQTYSGTRKTALEQNRNAIVADVSFGIAGAAAISAVIVGIVSASSSSKPAVTIAPTAGPSGAGLCVGGAF